MISLWWRRLNDIPEAGWLWHREDVMINHIGEDTLDGGLGNDTLISGMGNDTYIFKKDITMRNNRDGWGWYPW